MVSLNEYATYQALAGHAHAYATEAAKRYRSLLPTHLDLEPNLAEVLTLLDEIDESRAPRTPRDPATAAPEATPGSPDTAAR